MDIEKISSQVRILVGKIVEKRLKQMGDKPYGKIIFEVNFQDGNATIVRELGYEQVHKIEFFENIENKR